MSNYYNVEEIKNALLKDIAAKSAMLSEWKKVYFPTKKDGKPFANMAKNISGATYKTESFAWRDYEKEITISANVPGCGWKTDTIKAYELIRYMKDAEKLAKTENFMPKEPMLEQHYLYDLEDIKKAIAGRIESLTAEIEHLKTEFEIAETAYNAFLAAYKSALAKLAEDTKKNDYSSLYYMIRDTVKERGEYL